MIKLLHDGKGCLMYSALYKVQSGIAEKQRKKPFNSKETLLKYNRVKFNHILSASTGSSEAALYAG